MIISEDGRKDYVHLNKSLSLLSLLQVCSSAADYEAYDGELGLCVCAETPGRAACGGLCRKRLATELKLRCKSSGELELVLGYHSQVSKGQLVRTCAFVSTYRMTY